MTPSLKPLLLALAIVVMALICGCAQFSNSGYSKDKGSGYEVTQNPDGLYTVKVDAKIGDFTIYDTNNESIYDSRIYPMDANGPRGVFSHMGGCFRAHVPQEYTFYSNSTPSKMLEFDMGENGIVETWHPITLNKLETVWMYCDEHGFCEER